MSLQGIEQLEKLEHVNVSGNRIGQLEPVAGLTFLRGLDVSDNDVSDVAPLGRCPDLESLNIGGDRIADISPLAAAKNLKTLCLTDVKFTIWPDTKPVGHLMAKTGIWSLERGDTRQPAPSRHRPGGYPGHCQSLFVPASIQRALGCCEEDGPDAQFHGTAARIGLSPKFAVHLVRGTETLDDEWSLVSVGDEPAGPLAMKGFGADGPLPQGAKLIALVSEAANFLIWTAVLDEDTAVTQAGATFLRNSGFTTCDVLP